MATYWVRAVNGDDVQDGLSFDTARQTMRGIALKMVADNAPKNSICNVHNEGTYTWETVETDLSTGAGTSFTDFGYLFRGVSDESETPAYATIAATGADAVRRMFRMVSGSAYHIFRNLIFDATAKPGDSNLFQVLRWNSASGPVWFDGCALKVSDSGVSAATAGNRDLLNIQSSSASLDGTRVWDCYFQNPTQQIHGITGGTIAVSQIGNLVYLDAAHSFVVVSRTLAAGTGDTFDFTFNTLYYSVGNAAINSPITYSAGGTNLGANNVHSNLLFVESTNASPDIEFLDDTTGGSVPFTGTIGYNVFLGGPNVTIADVSADGYYHGTFDGGSDPKATDQVAYSQAEATVFNDPSSTYAWDALGNGATVTILKDLRPRLFLTAALGGGVPGALPAAQTDYGIDLATDNTAPEAGDAFTITVTASNTGTAATGVTMTAPIPAGLTLVLATPSAGSYDSLTGIWTIGALASGGSATLTLAVTVDSDQAGNTIEMTATTTSGDPATDPNAANDTDTLTLPIPLDDDVDPVATTFLDVAPIFAPVLTAEINAILRTTRNRVPHHELRKDYERRKWREYSARRMTIAPSTTVSIVTAIERIDFFVLEATDDLEVSVSNSATDVFFPPVQRLALLAGDFTTLKLRNPSATASVDAILLVID